MEEPIDNDDLGDMEEPEDGIDHDSLCDIGDMEEPDSEEDETDELEDDISNQSYIGDQDESDDK